MRSKPSCLSTFGSQPKICFALVMSIVFVWGHPPEAGCMKCMPLIVDKRHDLIGKFLDGNFCRITQVNLRSDNHSTTGDICLPPDHQHNKMTSSDYHLQNGKAQLWWPDKKAGRTLPSSTLILTICIENTNDACLQSMVSVVCHGYGFLKPSWPHHKHHVVQLDWHCPSIFSVWGVNQRITINLRGGCN